MKKIILSAALLAITPGAASAVEFYGVDETNNLIRFDAAAPGTVLSSVTITGIGSGSILAMDYRVADEQLYALSDNFSLYTINPATGVSTLITGQALTGTNFAFDFNPTNTNLRIVSNDNTNYVRNFATNALVPGTNVAYGPGDANFGVGPDIIGAAYINNDTNPVTGTALFVLDSRNDLLATQNAATGVLTTIGSLGVNIGSRTSFDIFTDAVGGINTGFVASGNTLYNVNLSTGALTSIGTTSTTLFAMAAVPVPEPSTWVMMLAGFGLAGWSMRRRAKVTLSFR